MGSLTSLAKLPLYRAQRRLGVGWMLPVHYTVNVLYACNARCKTCFVWERKVDPLTVDEYAKVAASIDQRGLWMTLTGGEPFLRHDLADIADVLIERIRPGLLNLPTNATFPDRVVRSVERLARRWSAMQLVVNVSLDELGTRHDEIRGFPGNWDLAQETLAALKKLQARTRNLTIGIHTVLSKHNVARFPEICDGLLALEPDSYITEVAEERVELRTRGMDLLPSAADYRRAMDHLSMRLADRDPPPLARLIARLREEYYRDVQSLLETGEEIRGCLAGSASVHLLPDGEVVACGVRGDTLGYLREEDYDLARIWRSARASDVRASIVRDHCRCPLASQAYVNLAADPVALGGVAARALGAEVGRFWRTSQTGT